MFELPADEVTSRRPHGNTVTLWGLFWTQFLSTLMAYLLSAIILIVVIRYYVIYQVANAVHDVQNKNSR